MTGKRQVSKLRIMTLDDERFALENLNNAILAVMPDAEVQSFTRASDVLRKIETGGYRPEAAFLDIEMPGITGIELAERIKKYSSKTWIIFVSGYSQYALDAFSVHAGGYVLKPATPKSIRDEFDHMRECTELPQDGKHKLVVRCFGNFEVFSDNVPVTFSRQKAKELFAYLVHKRGAACTTRELAAVLFEDEPYDIKRQSYMRTIIASMIHTLRDICGEDIVFKAFGTLAVDTSYIDCDYYRFLAMEPDAINTYTGDYMSQYEWGEFAIGIMDDSIQ